jgi:hypothetical protein
MNKYKTHTGVQTDVTWDDLLYTPEANRAFIHAYGKAVSGDTDMILQGCVFTVSTGLGTNATITAGYVYDQTSGEVVRVEAQTVVETLGNDTWELVKTTTYDAAGDNVYRDLATKQNYQQERMVLTNVAAITNFDAENADSYGGWKRIPNADITSTTTGVSINSSYTRLDYTRKGKEVNIIGQILFATTGAFVAAKIALFRFPDSYFSIDGMDGVNNVTFAFGAVTDTNGGGNPPEICAVNFEETSGGYTVIQVIRPTNFATSNASYRIFINTTLKVL